MKILLLLLLALYLTTPYAKTFNVDGIEVEASGYLGYQYIGTTTPSPGDTIVSTPQVGLILNVKLTDDLVIYNQFKFSDHLIGVPVYNFISYSPKWFKDVELNFVGGNIIHNYGLYGTTRQNPRTRQSVIEPQAIYWNILERSINSGVGIGASIEWNDIQLRYDIAKPTIIDNKDEAQAWSGPLLNSIQVEFGSTHIISLNWTPKHLPVRMVSSYSTIDLGTDANINASRVNWDAVKSRGSNIIEVANIGGEYTRGPVTLSAESIVVRTPDREWKNIGDLPYGYSLSANYDIDDNWTARLNYNVYKSNITRLPGGNRFPQLGYAKDINFGVDYTKENWLIRGEIHHINGGRWVQPSQFMQDPDSFKTWWMGGVSLTYFFD